MTEREIFTAALNKADPAQRATFLDEQCAGNAPLRERIESLLAEHQQLGSFMDVPSPGATIDQPAERPGTQIGPYKLLQQIGEGGMGVVYMAEQTEPVQRKVALKVIKPGMDSRQVVARFEAERQALAMMDHVNIARVLDAGATESGRPYFVMELVHGVPITKYCDDNRLTPRQRLELFVPVCQAIQHAHQKGIIHRDIKPSNVMVTLYDGKPVPKVIDFGVAKAIEQKLTEQTLFTQYGTMVGTLEYMSPEQAEMSALGVDTRSDIFSLGVLLYELLTGSTPLSSKRMKEVAYAEILRLIKEEEPPNPSTRLSESGEALASISAQRHTEPAKLSKLMRGELDWIVMKTLEKDRNRRYETAKDFATDVQRYLNDETVQACPPSAGYRFRKFARRNRGAVLTAVAISAALLVGTAAASWEALRATRAQATTLAALAEKEQARAAEAEQRLIAEASAQQARAATAAEKKAKQNVEAKELEARAVLDFVQNKVFAAARPKGQAGGLGHDVSLRHALEAALPFVEQNFTGQPLIEARLRLTLGESFEYLGEYKIAAEQFQAVRTIYAQHLGPDHISTLGSMLKLAQSYYRLGRYADQVKVLEERLSLQKAKYGTEHPDTLWSRFVLAGSYGNIGRHADAIQIYEELAVLLKAKRGPVDDSTLPLCLSGLALSYRALGRHADAIRVYEETVVLQKAKLGLGDKSTLMTMNGLAESYIALGRRADAVKLYEELLPLWKARFGPDHFAKFETVNRQRSIDFDLKFGEMERNLAQQKAQLGADHADTLRTMRDLAASYANFPDYVGQGETLKLRQQEFTARKVQLGADHPDTLWTMRELAALYGSRGLHNDAVKLYEELIPLQKAKLGTDHPTTLRCMRELADRYTLIRRHAEAVNLYEELLPLQKAKLGPDHPDTLRSMRELADCYYTIGRHAETVKLFEELLPLQIAKLGPDHPDTLRSMNSLAWVLAMHEEPARRDPGRAVSLAKEAVELKPQEGTYCNTLGTALYRAGRWKDAIETLERADQLSAGKHFGYNAIFIAMAHWQLGDKDNARVWYDKAVLWMEQNEPKSEELRRFRAEAEELMKVEKKKD